MSEMKSFRLTNLPVAQPVRAALRVLLAVLLVAVGAGAGGSLAQDQKTPPKPNPVGAGWEGNVKPADETSAQTFTPEQTATINKVNTYFSALGNLRGRFVQVDPDKAQTRGKFYVKKPGMFRFDYARPSRKIVISDGRFLAIQDLDLRDEDVYELDNTPFRILLRKDVDLLRDARIVSVSETPEQISLTLADKDPDAVGELTVHLAQQPEVALAGWITADAQGLETRVDVSDLTIPESLSSDLFRRKKLFRDAVRQ
ncbi:MAG: LolA family protein [Hyphomicrobiaceae bacterium]